MPFQIFLYVRTECVLGLQDPEAQSPPCADIERVRSTADREAYELLTVRRGGNFNELSAPKVENIFRIAQVPKFRTVIAYNHLNMRSLMRIDGYRFFIAGIRPGPLHIHSAPRS